MQMCCAFIEAGKPVAGLLELAGQITLESRMVPAKSAATIAYP